MGNIISIVLIIILGVAALTGFRRGMLRDGRHLISVGLGLLAIPIVSPTLEGLIHQSALYKAIPDNMITNYLSSYFIRIIIFSLVMFATSRIVFLLINIEDMPAPMALIDHLLGVAWSVFKICVVIWLFDSLLSLTPTISMGVVSDLRNNEIWQLIASHNILPYIFAKIGL